MSEDEGGMGFMGGLMAASLVTDIAGTALITGALLHEGKKDGGMSSGSVGKKPPSVVMPDGSTAVSIGGPATIGTLPPPPHELRDCFECKTRFSCIPGVERVTCPSCGTEGLTKEMALFIPPPPDVRECAVETCQFKFTVPEGHEQTTCPNCRVLQSVADLKKIDIPLPKHKRCLNSACLFVMYFPADFASPQVYCPKCNCTLIVDKLATVDPLTGEEIEDVSAKAEEGGTGKVLMAVGKGVGKGIMAVGAGTVFVGKKVGETAKKQDWGGKAWNATKFTGKAIGSGSKSLFKGFKKQVDKKVEKDAAKAAKPPPLPAPGAPIVMACPHCGTHNGVAPGTTLAACVKCGGQFMLPPTS